MVNYLLGLSNRVANPTNTAHSQIYRHSPAPFHVHRILIGSLGSMDYLNLVSTRSIILFAPPSPTIYPSIPRDEFSSPPASPTTPTAALKHFTQPLPLPQPIAIPLDAFHSGGRDDSDLAYFLVRHVLASWAKARGPDGGGSYDGSDTSSLRVERGERGAGARDLGYGVDDTCTFGGGAGIGRAQPDRTRDAEELAWIEIYKAKTFVTRLGAKWAQGKVGEKDMRGMARALGLVLKERRSVEA